MIHPAISSRAWVRVAEQFVVQKLVAYLVVQAFYDAVLHWLAGGDVVPCNLGVGAPRQDGVGGQLCRIIADDHPGLASPFDQRRQFPGDTAARDRCVGDRGQAFPCDVVHYVQHPKPPPAGELVMREVEGPVGIGARLDQDRGPRAERLTARFAFADG